MSRSSVAIFALATFACRAHEESLLCAPCVQGSQCPLGLSCVDGLCMSPAATCDAPSEDVPSTAACAVDGPIVAVATETDVRNQLIGRWLFCEGTKLGDEHELGVEFTEEGFFALLADGSRVPRGTWAVGGVIDALTIDLRMGNARADLHLTFTDNPKKFYYSSSVPEGAYLRWGETASPPADVPYYPPAACTQAGTQIAADTERALIGTWALCSGDVANQNVKGIVFRPDGTFFYLDIDENRELVAANGRLSRGTWRLESPGYIGIVYADGGQDGGSVYLHDRPRQLALTLSGGGITAVDAEHYFPARVPPPPPPPAPCAIPETARLSQFDATLGGRPMWFHVDVSSGACRLTWPFPSEYFPRGLFFIEYPDGTFGAFGSPTGANAWRIESSTAGTLDAAGMLSNIPASTPVTATVEQLENRARLDISFTYEAAQRDLTITEVVARE